MLFRSSLPLKYWFDDIATSVFLINRLPSSKLNHLSPFEKLYHQPPDYTLLKVFGCTCYPWLRPYHSHKLGPRSTPCVFLSYHPSFKGYRCLDPSLGKVYISRHVQFDETSFPFAHTTSTSTSPSLCHIQNFFWSSIPSCHSSSTSTSSPPITPFSSPISSSSPLSHSSPTSISTNTSPLPSPSSPPTVSSTSSSMPLTT